MPGSSGFARPEHDDARERGVAAAGREVREWPAGMRPGLAALIYPQAPEQFFRRYWPRRTFLTHHRSTGQLSELLELPELGDLGLLLRRAAGLRVLATPPSAADESNNVPVDPHAASWLFREGWGLQLGAVAARLPKLQTWLKAIFRDLGLPSLTFARCLIYATPRGGRTTAHFDSNANFVVQITGRKRWRLAENRHVAEPTLRYSIVDPGGLAPELQAESRGPLPRRMPRRARSFLLRPGSVLFVPRSSWHETRAESDSVAVNFTFSQPTWSDVVSVALRHRLNADVRWRGLADGLGSGDRRRKRAAMQRFEVLLAELGPSWNAEELVAALPKGPYVPKPRS